MAEPKMRLPYLFFLLSIFCELEPELEEDTNAQVEDKNGKQRPTVVAPVELASPGSLPSIQTCTMAREEHGDASPSSLAALEQTSGDERKDGDRNPTRQCTTDAPMETGLVATEQCQKAFQGNLPLVATCNSPSKDEYFCAIYIPSSTDAEQPTEALTDSLSDLKNSGLRRRNESRKGTSTKSSLQPSVETESTESVSSASKELEEKVRSEKQTALALFTTKLAAIVGALFSAKGLMLSGQAGKEGAAGGAPLPLRFRFFLGCIGVLSISFIISSYNVLMTTIEPRSHKVLKLARWFNCTGVAVMVIGVLLLLFDFMFEALGYVPQG